MPPAIYGTVNDDDENTETPFQRIFHSLMPLTTQMNFLTIVTALILRCRH